MRRALVALLALLGAWVPQQPVRSVYSSLDVRTCRLLSKHAETGATLHRCPGVGGYALQVADDDARMSVNVVAPGGRVYPLSYWGVVTSAFSSLGPRAEWRVRGTRPHALIVRVNANEDPANPERVTSYLAVARVTPRGACVTDRIRPSANANALARQAADRSATRPCLRG
ncbi:MAG: hypothetical protein ICV87_00320 [Gemmatimonadetes bacterium]|nr:hypothetical protein [Gemmatimonadota bacterium]